MAGTTLQLLLSIQIIKYAYSNFALDYVHNKNAILNTTNVLNKVSRTSAVTCTLKCVQSDLCAAMNMKCENEEDLCDCDLLGNFALSASDLTQKSAEYSYIGPG